jgi:hypothetical protein
MKYIDPQAHRDLPTHPEHRDHPGHREHHVRPISSPLHVLTVVMNPARYYSRYRLYHAFADMVEEAGGILYTVEVATRDRHFEVTDPHNPRHLQLRSPAVVWQKERALNVGIERLLPASWEYVATVDADVVYANPRWVDDTLHQLQLYPVVQMFSQCQDLGPTFELIGQSQRSFGWQHVHGGIPAKHKPNGHHGHGHHGHDYPGDYPHRTPGLAHPGYAWAYRRSALSDLGNLGDVGILGSGDHQMAMALIGRVADSIHPKMHASYLDYWLTWQERAEHYVRRNVGYVNGLLLHHFHGAKTNRRYGDRWQILTDERFDWSKDLKRDVQGLWALTERNHRLRDRIKQYFFERNEDSIDV